MEIEKSNCKGSKNIMKFLGYFSCFNCGEIGNFPYILICNHIYCENCVSNYNMKKNDGSLVCPYCYMITQKSDILPELDVKLLISHLKSIGDEEFEQKYENKINFINEMNNKNNNDKLRNITSFLIKFLSSDFKKEIKNNSHKRVYKRSYLEFKKETFLPDKGEIYEATFKGKPTFKYN